MMVQKKLIIGGIHCESCKTLIETEIDVIRGVSTVQVDHKTGQALIEFDDDIVSVLEITKAIENLNYKVEKKIDILKPINNDSSRMKKAPGLIAASLVFILLALYFFMGDSQAFGIMEELNKENVAYSIIFVIGLLAGLHCVGMCGGLVVAYSSREIKKQNKSKLKPHLQYNVGRIISYTLIGGILGGLGSFFGVNPAFTGAVTLLAGIFMILMGLSFLTNWSVLDKIKLRTPKFIAGILYNNKHSKKVKGPLVIGLLTGFMPCGPLQAMQLYALASGDFYRGALAMLVYALGTVPLLLGFGWSLSSISSISIRRVLKFSGVLVVVLGFFMASRGLASFGIGYDKNYNTTKNNASELSADFQEVRMELTYYGYKPNTLYIERGVPVRWVIDVKQMSGCTDVIMIESLGIRKDLVYGENIIEFTPPSNVSEIKFSCWMKMVWGKFVVTDDKKESKETTQPVYAAPISEPSSGSCNGSCGSATCGATRSGSCGCGG